MERHHPAGRRKAAFLYTVMLAPGVHDLVHAEPAWAESVGLLWPGRNSKIFTLEDARELARLRPCLITYPEDLFQSTLA